MTKYDVPEAGSGGHRQVLTAGEKRRHCTLENFEVKPVDDDLLSAG